MARLKAGEVCRNAACLIWQEELEAHGKTYGDLLAFCEGLNIPVAVSPWHNKDRYTADDVRKWVDRHIDPDFYDFISEDIEEVRSKAPRVGDFKKTHAHVIIKNAGPRNRDYFTKLFAPFLHLSPTKWEKVEHLEAMTQYLCHKNTPSKHRYSELDIHGFGGYDLSCLLKDDKLDKLNTLMVVCKEIENGRFRYYHQLDFWAKSTGDMDIINCVSGRSSYFGAIFRSLREERLDKAQSAKEEREKAQAGEVAVSKQES